jgi:uncharacterized glyoxalase superfamily protein PhnB
MTTDFPTASLGSSQAPTDAVEKSPAPQTQKSGHPPLPTRAAVDQRYAELTAAGYASRQCPFDAFWGQRYAIVTDPDGHDVGLMSPLDETRRTWPPVASPDS